MTECRSCWHICQFCSTPIDPPRFGMSWCDTCRCNVQALITDGRHVWREQALGVSTTDGRQPHGN